MTKEESKVNGEDNKIVVPNTDKIKPKLNLGFSMDIRNIDSPCSC